MATKNPPKRSNILEQTLAQPSIYSAPYKYDGCEIPLRVQLYAIEDYVFNNMRFFFVFLFKVITKEANVRVKVIPKRNGGYIEGRSREAGVIPSRSGY